MDDQAVRRRSRVKFLAVALGVLVVGFAGYSGFTTFARSSREIGAGVVVLGAVTGFAAFFSPCSFPLLLTFLAKRASESKTAATLSALRVGAGAALLLAVFAAVIVAGGSAVAGVLEFDSAAGRIFRGLVGTMLMVFGLRQARLISFRIELFDRVAGSAAQALDPSKISSPARRDFLYGFGYLLAGFG